MYKKNLYQIRENKRIAAEIYRMVLEGDTQYLTAPGQFVNLKLDGFYLRRPISVCDWDANSITLIYKTVGNGTEQMSRMRSGEKLDVLTGLGNGFDLRAVKPGQTAALVGGGVGVPPLYALAKALLANGVKVLVVLGFNEASQVFYQKEFEVAGASVMITTVDGSTGQRGFVTDALRDASFDYYYACGPEPMLRALHALGREKGIAGELSFEARMGCGFGACMGCSCQTLTGNKRICVEGPVMKSGEVMF